MTQLEAARNNKITPEMKAVAKIENIEINLLCQLIRQGEVVILRNKKHSNINPVAVGTKMRTKVNANIGTSQDYADIKKEVEKAKVAVKAGTDTIMDLSTGGNLRKIRQKIMQQVPVVIGTVPIYQTVIETIEKKSALINMTSDDIFQILEQQAEEGVDFFTVHCGVTLASIERLIKQGRLTNIVSRGGSFLTTWMIANEKENPLYEEFERLLEIAYKYDVTLSLGDGLRPGSVHDATDRAQITELIILGELTKKARDKNVQVMIEGPGHIPLHQIETNIKLQKQICDNAPFYVLGPIVTDIAPGYDHITSAIGGSIAAANGADFLCYVTPGEHLKLPNKEDVRQGVIAARIAAHAADISKGLPGAIEWDNQISQARKELDWKKQIELSLDPDLAQKLREEGKPHTQDVCSMCGEYCAIKMVNKILKNK